ncbi:MAG: putative Ig domain-containing protein [Candidatus Sulfotelmatobacter sp.]
MHGSTLPSGLTLSSAGAITGTVASTVTAGTYTFSATATDSSPVLTATGTFSVLVSKTTGASCSNILSNAPGGSGPIVPITDLGTNLYEGAESGPRLRVLA